MITKVEIEKNSERRVFSVEAGNMSTKELKQLIETFKKDSEDKHK